MTGISADVLTKRTECSDNTAGELFCGVLQSNFLDFTKFLSLFEAYLLQEYKNLNGYGFW